MNYREKKRDKWLQSVWYLGIYLAFQIILGVMSFVNGCWDAYLGLIFYQLLLGIAIVMAALKEGNVKIVLYASMLLSIGQLIQSMIQKEEAYTEYLKDYQIFFILAVILGIIIWILYKKYFGYMYTWWMQICVCAIIVGIFVILKTGLGYEQNHALLWIRIGGFTIQVTEFLKPLLVFALAGFLCRKKKVSLLALLAALGFTGLVSALCVVLLNEFGTGLVMALTGLTLMYIFQNTKISKVVISILIAGTVLVGICYMYGNWRYHNIPMQVTDEIFAQEFSACGNKSKLAQLLDEYAGEKTTEALEEEEGEMGFTYSEVSRFLREQIQNTEVDSSYPGASKDGLNSVQIKLINYMTAMSSNEEFRRLYRDNFLNQKIYASRMLAAYDRMLEEDSVSFLGKTKGKAENLFLKVYFPIAEKIQSKFSGFLDPEGEKGGNAYQVNQAMNAMSTGGLFGNGPDVDKSGKIFASDSDMVFSMIVSELGFVMGFAVILLNMLIFREAVRIGLEASSLYQKGICIGLGTSWIIQAFLIIGGNCRLLPLTGITLPLIAAGGTSLIVNILMIWLLFLISLYPEKGRMKKVKKKIRRKKYKKTDRGSVKEEEVFSEWESVKQKDESTGEEENIAYGQEQDKSEEEEWENPFRDM